MLLQWNQEENGEMCDKSERNDLRVRGKNAKKHFTVNFPRFNLLASVNPTVNLFTRSFSDFFSFPYKRKYGMYFFSFLKSI